MYRSQPSLVSLHTYALATRVQNACNEDSFCYELSEWIKGQGMDVGRGHLEA